MVNIDSFFSADCNLGTSQGIVAANSGANTSHWSFCLISQSVCLFLSLSFSVSLSACLSLCFCDGNSQLRNKDCLGKIHCNLSCAIVIRSSFIIALEAIKYSFYFQSKFVFPRRKKKEDKVNNKVLSHWQNQHENKSISNSFTPLFSHVIRLHVPNSLLPVWLYHKD